MENNEFKGYSLFNDVEDVPLRIRNRAVILANIAEQNMRKRKISPKGASLMVGYFNAIPMVERKMVYDKFEEVMEERHFVKE